MFTHERHGEKIDELAEQHDRLGMYQGFAEFSDTEIHLLFEHGIIIVDEQCEFKHIVPITRLDEEQKLKQEFNRLKDEFHNELQHLETGLPKHYYQLHFKVSFGDTSPDHKYSSTIFQTPTSAASRIEKAKEKFSKVGLGVLSCEVVELEVVKDT